MSWIVLDASVTLSWCFPAILRRFAANMAWLHTMRFMWSWPCGRGVHWRPWIRTSGTLPWQSE